MPRQYSQRSLWNRFDSNTQTAEYFEDKEIWLSTDPVDIFNTQFHRVVSEIWVEISLQVSSVEVSWQY